MTPEQVAELLVLGHRLRRGESVNFLEAFLIDQRAEEIRDALNAECAGAP